MALIQQLTLLKSDITKLINIVETIAKKENQLINISVTSQQHSGGGDNVGNNKNVNNS